MSCYSRHVKRARNKNRRVMNQSGLTHKHLGNTLKNVFQKLLNTKNFKILTTLTCHNHMQHTYPSSYMVHFLLHFCAIYICNFQY